MAYTYIKLEVWKQLCTDSIYCYHIFQNSANKRYSVQSRDTIRLSQFEHDLVFSKKQSVELFAEVLPDVRDKSYISIEEAIEEFDKSFDV